VYCAVESPLNEMKQVFVGQIRKVIIKYGCYGEVLNITLQDSVLKTYLSFELVCAMFQGRISSSRRCLDQCMLENGQKAAFVFQFYQ
jgi:hypothetical protein